MHNRDVNSISIKGHLSVQMKETWKYVTYQFQHSTRCFMEINIVSFWIVLQGPVIQHSLSKIHFLEKCIIKNTDIQYIFIDLLVIPIWKVSLSPLNVLHPQRDSKRKGSTYSSRLERQPWTGDHAFTLNKTPTSLITRDSRASKSCSTRNTVQFSLIHLEMTCISLIFLPLNCTSSCPIFL